MCIATKTIGELKGYSFFVPAYQRGYRWTGGEVGALLDDINDSPVDSKYCIQPLIVKGRDDGKWEVVDGQQRLTTIYIFMKIAQQEIRSAVPLFDLVYETREKSTDFLNSLPEKSHSGENIDFQHMANAYDAMDAWLGEQTDKSVAIQKMNTKIRESVFFILHKMPEGSNPVDMFTKVNSGKIPLTNAELIKALLLNSDNFAADTAKRQIEISTAWDRIEQGLQDDSFWYFLNQKNGNGPRIDMLFELLATRQNVEAQKNAKKNESQQLFPFLVFYTALKTLKPTDKKEQYVTDLWKEVESLYAEFRDWYEDLNKYHVIGYLIASETKLSEIYQCTRGKRKSEVMQILREKACNTVEAIDKDKIELTYTDNAPQIRRLLLLFNIATLVRKSEKQYRFPFHIYKDEKWDIEHIRATKDESDEGEADDTLRNLTLLDRGTNRSYKNVPFNEKRRIIMERESAGLFVPLCTKNIFLKAYSKNPGNMASWGKDNKSDYLMAMKTTLESFKLGEMGK